MNRSIRISEHYEDMQKEDEDVQNINPNAYKGNGIPMKWKKSTVSSHNMEGLEKRIKQNWPLIYLNETQIRRNQSKTENDERACVLLFINPRCVI